MELWKQKAPAVRRELYYYDTSDGFEAARLAARLYSMLKEELQRAQKENVLFLFIGTDRSTGDSLGPLIGHQLYRKGLRHITVVGTLEYPVHAMNLEDTLYLVRERYPDHLVVAVDASVGKTCHVGCVTLGRGALRPGLGVSKNLQAVGDLFITGVVSGGSSRDPMMLQSIRLGMVMHMAECISDSICLVEKLWESLSLV